MSEQNSFKSNRHILYSCKYHVVFCPKYRRKVLVEGVDIRLKEIIYQVATELACEVMELEVMPDHVHILCEVDPQFGVHKFVRRVKGRSSRLLRQEFPTIEKQTAYLVDKFVLCFYGWWRSYCHHETIHRGPKERLMKTYKFRLNPTRHQRTLLNNTLELCRWVYNETLATRKNAWEQEKKSISCYDTIKMLPGWKKEKPELSQVYSQVLQEVCKRVDLAFKAFFRRVKAGEKPGYPRFRGWGWYDSFTYPQTGFTLCDHGLLLSKIGGIKIVQHRPMEGKIKTLNISRDAVGNWYACFSCEVESMPLPESKKAIGVDVGL